MRNMALTLGTALRAFTFAAGALAVTYVRGQGIAFRGDTFLTLPEDHEDVGLRVRWFRGEMRP